MVNYVQAAIALLASTSVNASYYPPTATYKPYTNITDSLELDVEQKELEGIIKIKTLDAFAAGLTYYKNSNLIKVDVDTTLPLVEYWGFDSPTKQFLNYYGIRPITEFVTAALSGDKTNFDLGNADFSSYAETEPDAIDQCAKKGSSYVVQYVAFLKQIELSVCRRSPSIASWDTAVAYYTGSLLEGVDGGPGSFGYSLAEKRGKNFKTLGDEGDSNTEGEQAKANIDIMRLFTAGGIDLDNGNIQVAKDTARQIVSLSRIPLVQGTLRYANKVANGAGIKAKAEGVAFAAGILPSVFHCNEASAKTIYDNMKFNSPSTDFLIVKRAFEQVYSCMGITCKDVGGLYDGGEYVDGGDPCTDSTIMQEDHNLRVQE